MHRDGQFVNIVPQDKETIIGFEKFADLFHQNSEHRFQDPSDSRAIRVISFKIPKNSYGPDGFFPALQA